MITNFNNNQSRKNDMKILAWIIAGFLFVAWLCTPPGNKFLQVCFWGNNTKFFVAKLTNNYETTEYIFHRNNAVYLAKMYQDKAKALKEMNKAIESIPSIASDEELLKLYKDRAYIRLQDGDYRGALSDFMNCNNISFKEYLVVALLFKEVGNYKEAISYCNAILNSDSKAYAGYACLSDVYTTLGRPDVGIKIWDLAVSKRPNLAQIYVDRALLKKKIGDFDGYHLDVQKAKELSPTVVLENSFIYDTLHPKLLPLTIQ